MYFNRKLNTETIKILGDSNSCKTARLCLRLAISSNWQSYAWLSLYKQIVNYLEENNKNDVNGRFSWKGFGNYNVVGNNDTPRAQTSLLLDTDFPLLMQFDLRFIDTARHTRLRFMTSSNDRSMISSVSFSENIHHTDRRIYRVSRVNSRNYLLNYSSFAKVIIIRVIVIKQNFRLKLRCSEVEVFRWSQILRRWTHLRNFR